MRTTEQRVKGLISDGYNIKGTDITVRITSDEMGKSLSLSDDDKILLMIPLDPVAQRLKEVLK